MNKVYAISVIFIVSLVTILIRFMPFVIFKKKVPDIINYLGKLLPYSIMAMLVIYCLKDTCLSFHSLLPTVISVIAVVIIHIRKKNILLSIVLGTTIYIILLNLIQ